MLEDHVAIDGFVASGKTTILQLVAAQTGHFYVAIGAMYRAVADLALKNGVDLE